MGEPAVSEGLVDLVVEEPGWNAALPGIETLAERGAELALGEAGVEPAGYTVCVLACDDARIAGLNAEFRGKAMPTNVLSWPAFDLAPASRGGPPKAPPPPAGPMRQPLGDVAIALQTTRREAAEAAIPLKDHFVHLILHGCLHLLGFDHETDEDAEMMELAEIRALASVGVADPYLRGGEARQDRK
jgi:probable rRNA maturation factor